MVKTIEWIDKRVRILDQSLLPTEVRYIDCEDYKRVAEAIKTMKIRGAPAIGIAAAMAIALGAVNTNASSFEELEDKLKDVYTTLLSTRPTAVNIRWAVERMKHCLSLNRKKSIEEIKQILIEEAKQILEEDIEVNRAIGRWGAEFIDNKSTIITHCNAGSLATGGYGTATAPIRVASKEGKDIHVIVDETRPLLQGARLTAWELKEDNIPLTLIVDSAAATLIKSGMIDLAIVGTDRTAKNGDVANKIGTYPLAVMCNLHNVPFYVAAPLSSIDFSINSGDEIEIEERPPDEITHIKGIRIAPEGIEVKNIAFDVTPSHLITGIITEKGVFKPSHIKMLEYADDRDLDLIRLRR